MSFAEFAFYDWVGVAGAGLLLLAYSLVLLGRWQPSDELYKLVNLAGAAAVAYSLIFKFNPAALVVELLWAGASLVSLVFPHWVDPDRRRLRRGPPSESPGARALLQEATKSLGPLISSATNLTEQEDYSASELRSMALELRGIRSMLARDVIVPALGTSAFRAQVDLFTAAEMTLRRVRPMAGKAMNRTSIATWEAILWRVRRTMLGKAIDPISIGPAFSAQLEALRRVLNAQLRTLGSSPALEDKERPVYGPAWGKTFAGGGSSNENQVKPDEGALVAAATEKLYGSAAFKVIGGALIAAALLAGAGTVYLGSHTLTLREDLEKSEEKGRKEIEKSRSELLEAINRQSTEVAAMKTDLQDKKIDFNQRFTEGKEQIVTIVKDFESKSDDLKRQIVDGVVAKMNEQLKNPLNNAITEIRSKGEQANREIDQFVSKILDPLNQRAKALNTDFARLNEAVAQRDQELQKMDSLLKRLRELEPQLTSIIKELGDIRTHQKEVADAAASAAAKAAEADQSAMLTAKARESILSTIKDLTDESGKVERSLGSLDGRLQAATKEVDGLQERIKAALPPGTDLATLVRQMGELANKLAEVDATVARTRTQMDAAASFAQAAQKSADQAEATRSSFTTAVNIVRDQVANHQEALGYIRKSIEDLNKQISEVKIPAGASPIDFGPINDLVHELGMRVKEIDARVKAIEAKSKLRTERDLSEGDIRAIQQRLLDLSFDPKGIDGAIGGNTRNAIQRWQQSRGEPATGTLTTLQIDELLAPLQPIKK